MSFPRYPAYRDSGVPWLGELPKHWQQKPLWSLFRRTKRTGYPAEQLLSVYRDYGVVPKASRDDNNNKPSDDLEPYQLVQPGDLAINKMKAWQGAVAISEHRGIVSPAYFIYEPTNSESPRYLHYLFRSLRYITGYLSMSKGIRVHQWDLEPQDHSRMPVAVPSLAEQIAIASFLDHETAKIDVLVDEQEKLIALLQEKRQAVISHAVTKGLDPTVPMKDSGVEWLGEVPAHWLIQPLKHTVQFRSGGTPDKSNRDYWDGDIPWASAKDLKTDDLCDTVDHITRKAIDDGAASVVSSGAVLVVVRGMILARTFPVVTAIVPMAINQDLKALKAKAHIHDGFLPWLLRGTAPETLNRLDEAGHGTKALRMDAWTAMLIVAPPYLEQCAIAETLRAETAKLDALVGVIQSSIALLGERRTALISAAVTGQIDVRGHVATEAAA